MALIGTVRPRLRPGSRVAIVSPASAAKPELVHQGITRLRDFGYEPVLMPHALSRGPLYYAGTAQERVDDLHAAFADSSIEGILCTRGGWGSAELLPLLKPQLIRENPKVFVGYSDHTSLQTFFLQKGGLQSFYAPMVAAEWSQPDGVDQRSWRAALEQTEAYAFDSADGLRVLREGKAEGRLLGGCLAIVEAGLGTPWALRIEEPCILFLEDIGVKPYQWDRMLQHLRFAGLLEQVQGIVLGEMSANVPVQELHLLEASCLHALREFTGPIAIGLRCGHVSSENRSIVIGAEAALQCTGEAKLTIDADQQADTFNMQMNEENACPSTSI
ncbi:MAG: S66 peptidase family protein [Janthinobacterium lividum]